MVSKIARALPGHYWIFTVRYVSQRFDTKPRTKPRKFAHFNTFRNVSKSVCALWGGRGRGFKSRHLDQHQSSQIRGFSVCGLFSFLLILPLREIFREILGRLTIFANYVNSVDAAFSASTLHLLSVFFVRYEQAVMLSHAFSCPRRSECSSAHSPPQHRPLQCCEDTFV